MSNTISNDIIPMESTDKALNGMENISNNTGIMENILSSLPLLIVFVLFYFFIIRPQSQQKQKFNETIKNTKKGDQVILASGITGIVNKVSDQYFYIEIAKNVEVQVLKDKITDIATKTISK